eukprot:2088794-Alexandrium_andersonii.AAC.1
MATAPIALPDCVPMISIAVLDVVDSLRNVLSSCSGSGCVRRAATSPTSVASETRAVRFGGIAGARPPS